MNTVGTESFSRGRRSSRSGVRMATVASTGSSAGGGGAGAGREPVLRAPGGAGAAGATVPASVLSPDSVRVMSGTAPNQEPRQYSRSCTNSVAVW
jgi:hypothetical protein